MSVIFGLFLNLFICTKICDFDRKTIFFCNFFTLTDPFGTKLKSKKSIYRPFGPKWGPLLEIVTTLKFNEPDWFLYKLNAFPQKDGWWVSVMFHLSFPA